MLFRRCLCTPYAEFMSQAKHTKAQWTNNWWVSAKLPVDKRRSCYVCVCVCVCVCVVLCCVVCCCEATQRHMVLEFVRLLELRLQPCTAGQAQVLDRGLQLAREVADADARASHATRLRRSRRKNMNRRLRARSQRQ